MELLDLTGENLTLETMAEVAYQNRPVRLSSQARQRMEASRSVVEKALSDGSVIYGVTTGLGKLADTRISPQDIRDLQRNLVRSHASGVGEPLSEPETRALLLLRSNVLAKGYSGVRPVVAETLLELLNRQVTPVVPCRGSVGASGDLAPLAHVASLLIGEGEAIYQGRRMSGQEAMREAGIPPLTLEAKEGLSLVNGTDAALAVGALALLQAEIAADTADLAGALSLDALKGTPAAFDERIQTLRPYPGQKEVAAHLREMLEESEIRHSHLDCGKVQDAYSLRCISQVHGAVRENLRHIRKIIETEMRSVTDNPIVFPAEGEILSGGNFHGQPLAFAFDLLAIVLTSLGGISERRIERLVNPERGDLPPFLSPKPGLHSAFMVAQVTAAALASENKVLSHPASVDSIPTSGNREDYISMAMGAALKLKQIIENLFHILAIELLAAAQGVEYHSPLRPGKGLRKVMGIIRSRVPPLIEDRPLSPDIEEISQLIRQGEFRRILTSPLTHACD